MIDDRALRDRASLLRVPEAQVRRDHELSHLIFALRSFPSAVFIGGTALHRTYLPDLRLSEDLDIHLLDGVADDLVAGLLDGVRLEFPGLAVEKIQRVEDRAQYQLRDAAVTLKVEVVQQRTEWRDLPTSLAPVRLHYADLPETVGLTIPTAPSLVAMKLSAYVDRHASRDLFDLAALAEQGAFSEEALALTRGLLGRSLARQEFGDPPSKSQWTAELGHQTSEPGDPDVTLGNVRAALAELTGWPN